MDRRTFNTALISAAATSITGCATSDAPSASAGASASDGRTMFYQAVGDQLTHWDVNVGAATLTRRESATLPSNIQYAWLHPSKKFMYVSTSDAASGNAPNPGKVHRLCAVRVDPNGALAPVGTPAALPQRPIHNSVDVSGAWALTCYNNPSNLTVHRILDDGTVGAQVQQQAKLEYGIFAHQILATPGNRSVVMVTRGNRPEGNKAEDPGALKVYRFISGQLTPHANLAVGGKGGFGYGPRHLDFHPNRPWVYVSVEIQNELHMHTIQDGNISPEPLYRRRSTIGTFDIHAPQQAGAIKIHPNGRTAYVSNRVVVTLDANGKAVYRRGENNIAVFAINPGTGEPTLIQNEDPRSFHIRTLSIDPSGKIMVAASIVDMNVREGNNNRYVPAALTVFRIGDDGKLTFARKYDVELGGKFQWWTGLVGLG